MRVFTAGLAGKVWNLQAGGLKGQVRNALLPQPPRRTPPTAVAHLATGDHQPCWSNRHRIFGDRAVKMAGLVFTIWAWMDWLGRSVRWTVVA